MTVLSGKVLKRVQCGEQYNTTPYKDGANHARRTSGNLHFDKSNAILVVNCYRTMNISNVMLPLYNIDSIICSLSENEKAMLAGGLAGTVAKTVTAPLSRLTILFQIHPAVTKLEGNRNMSAIYAKNLLGGFRRVVSEEGFFSLWKVRN